MEAIKAATSVPAQMLGQAEQFGSLKTGQLADITAVAANPLNDISELERVRFVMSNGKIIRNDFKSSTYAL